MNRVSNHHLEIYFHLLLAIILYPVLLGGGAFIKFLILPYVIYLVASKDIKHFPALSILALSGSTITHFIILAAILYTLQFCKPILNSNYRNYFIVYLALFTVFFAKFLIQVVLGSHSFIDFFSQWSFFLVFFMVFYGLLLGSKITTEIIIASFLGILTIIFLGIANQNLFGKTRFVSIGTVYIVSIGIYSLYVMNSRYRIPVIVKILAAIILILFIGNKYETSFNTIFSMLLSFGILYSLTLKNSILINSLKKPQFYILLLILIVLIIANAHQMAAKFAIKGSVDYTSILNYPQFILYKAFGDRGIIWQGTFDILISKKQLLPPDEPVLQSYITSKGSIIENVNFGAHNTPLELMRCLGIMIGSILSVTYVGWTIELAKHIIYLKANFFMASSAAVLISLLIITGITGQYIIQPANGFFLFTMIGMLLLKANQIKLATIEKQTT